MSCIKLKPFGVLAVAVGVIFGGFKARAAAVNIYTDIPKQAPTYLPLVRAEQKRLWPTHPAPYQLAGLIEQETCITLKHSYCWNPKAHLKNGREEGAGLGQITRTFRPNGSVRFDTLAAMRSRYPELREWSWQNVYHRVDLQVRGLVLLSRSNFMSIQRFVPNPQSALAFAVSAYNSGLGAVQADRRACAMRSGCDPQQWFGHVELTCTRSHVPLYGSRSACAINREHVRNVVQLRSAKYARWFS
jgi:hypothetical protein